jgi:uncharacterized membrane protein
VKGLVRKISYPLLIGLIFFPVSLVSAKDAVILGNQIPVQAQYLTVQETNLLQASILDRMLAAFMRDPLANSISVITLIVMLVSVVVIGNHFLNAEDHLQSRWPTWLVAIFALLGIGVAIYLTFVETTHRQAICGPIGNCNSVQQSSYARLFGFLPVGVLGVIGYSAILLAWIVQKITSQRIQNFTALVIWGMAWFGILFSIYLTFLEAFVIGSTCVWCISSALLITLILWSSTGRALQALSIPDND